MTSPRTKPVSTPYPVLVLFATAYILQRKAGASGHALNSHVPGAYVSPSSDPGHGPGGDAHSNSDVAAQLRGGALCTNAYFSLLDLDKQHETELKFDFGT